jgi:hypothetical protein
MMNDIEDSGAISLNDLHVEIPEPDLPPVPQINRTVFFVPPPNHKSNEDFQTEIENARTALRFKKMLVSEEPEFRQFILRTCIDWLQINAPADIDIIAWFNNILEPVFPTSSHLNAGVYWNSLYSSICNKRAFQLVVQLFLPN